MSHSLTNSLTDMLDSDIDHGRQHSLVMEIEVGDDSTVEPLQLGYYKHKTASPCATCTSPAPTIYNVRT